MKALVLGGTRFFGIHLVSGLIEKGIHVSIATRGHTPDPFENRVMRIKADRENEQDLKTLFENNSFDLIFDQIGYSSHDAHILCSQLSGHKSRLIFTSTASVYTGRGLRPESLFDPLTYPIKMGRREHFDYREGKRQAEAILAQTSPVPVVMVRFPWVVGSDDYTERFRFHIEKMKQGQPIFSDDWNSNYSFVFARDAGACLAWCGQQDFVGPVNACSPDTISLNGLTRMIETVIGKPVLRAKEKSSANESPYSVIGDTILETKKIQDLGFRFKTITDWMPEVIRAYSTTN